MTIGQDIVWQPSDDLVKHSHMSQFQEFVSAKHQLQFAEYSDLHKWSVSNLGDFWQSLSEFTNIKWSQTPGQAYTPPAHKKMLGAKWFDGSRLNFAENIFHGMSDDSQVISVCEGREDLTLSKADLKNQVAQCAAYLKSNDVGVGDRVVGVMPNTEAAVIAMMATSSLGAVWSSCSPDFGEQGIVDRFGQIEPKVLFAVHNYNYNGKTQDCSDVIEKVVARIGALKSVCIIDGASESSRELSFAIEHKSFTDFADIKEELSLSFESVAFDAPLYIMFSSGTTGVPKCIIHTVGGTLLQHKKELMLHSNLGPKSKLLYFTTCGWMMWNWMVSALAVGSDLVLFEGSPAYPGISRLWEVLEQYEVNVFGTSPKFLSATDNADYVPAEVLNLSSLKTILSTGAPLLPEQYDWVANNVGETVHLASISGGTDIISCFMLGVPNIPVYRGQIQAPGLGMAVECWVDEKSVVGQKGELVCTKPFPSMPLGFWNDLDGERYRAAYFNFYDHVEIWRHGDFVSIEDSGGVVVYGRSDATLNPGGVRIGTAEIYRVVENLDGVIDSLAAAYQKDGDVHIVLFLILKDGVIMDEAFKKLIKGCIRQELTPRHVPREIFRVDEIPYTRSGKKLEIAVTRILHHDPVPNKTAIANAQCLTAYESLAEELS